MMTKSFCLIFIITNFCHNGESVNYNPYTSKSSSTAATVTALPQIEHHLLHGVAPAEAYNNNNPPASYSSYEYQQNHAVSAETNPQANRNYQQLYRYYNEATPLRHPTQTQPTHQLWSGPPIVVADDMYLTSNIPQTTYEYNTPYNALESMGRHSKALPVYRNQPELVNTQQLNYNNNNNIVYPRDFGLAIDGSLPESKGLQQKRPIYNQQQEYEVNNNSNMQFYASNRNLPYDDYAAIEPNQNNFNRNNRQYDFNRNYYESLRRDNVIDYTDYFKRYLENNPRRIEPLY